ncbi:hypothetical protein [Parapedobacter koreensis]|uniref:Uncharacterized protein n=1 Tax=Parapedobacter koreensis TaxID=332977 RepID=A0A1H7P4S6_9SPHI|nr:hypothetical protein [Parapedobacter koreensis]SEL30793.1 hypothetical protein SAMN05421740_104214 [Parapedobacter koreensis]
MKELHELENNIGDMADLQQQQERRITALENRKVVVPDYGPKLAEILNALRTDPAMPGPSAMQELGERMEQLSAKIPDRLSVHHRHEITGNAKGFIIAATIILCAFSIAVAVLINLWQRNGELRASSIKYRMVRQYYPGAAAWAERTYMANPDSARMDVERLEAEQEALRLAEEAAAKKEAEAREARDKADGMRKK